MCFPPRTYYFDFSALNCHSLNCEATSAPRSLSCLRLLGLLTKANALSLGLTMTIPSPYQIGAREAATSPTHLGLPSRVQTDRLVP